MPSLARGSFSINLGIVKLGADLSDEDRQAAWELYTELSTRVAVTGKSADADCTDFSGELYIESLNSLYSFFQEARKIMRGFPVGRLSSDNKHHLGVMISQVMGSVLRPFLEKWQVEYRHWWENQSNPRLSPMERQKGFPGHEAFIADWAALRWLMRELQKELIKIYTLVDVGAQEINSNTTRESP